MGKLTETQVKRAATLKAVRSAIRLKYSIMADAELNERLEGVEQAFDRAIAEGRPWELSTAAILKEIEAGDVAEV